jgi:alpha-D-ribose 1-methylphosphonate 5-phosphate C-P lyase
VQPLSFEDFAFRVESFDGRRCSRCGSAGTYLDEVIDDATGRRSYSCSDTAFCEKSRRDSGAEGTPAPGEDRA